MTTLILKATDVEPGTTATEVAKIALDNVGQSWDPEACSAFVWGVTNLAGLPFFELSDETTNGDPRVIQDPAIGFVVPHSPGIASGTADEPGDGWSNVPSPTTGSPRITSVSQLESVLQVGDVVRIYRAGDTLEQDSDAQGTAAHSFIVVSTTGGNIQVVDNWQYGTTISEHSFQDIVTAWTVNGQFDAAFVSRINSAYVIANVNQNNLQGNGFGSSSIWTALATNHAPAANNDSYSTNANTVLTVSAALGVLHNDTDADGNTLTAFLATNPNHGTLSLNPNGAFTYTPTSGYSGTDSFTYYDNDGTAFSTSPATVSITVAAQPATTAPVVSGAILKETPGIPIPLSQLFAYSSNTTSFDVRDRTVNASVGGGYLTLNGNHQTEFTTFGPFPISQIGQWAFVPGSAGSVDLVGFDAYDSSGGANAGAVVVAQQGNNPLQGLDTGPNLPSLVAVSSQLNAADYSFVIGYYSYPPAAKILTASEVNTLAKNNLQICAVFEYINNSQSYFSSTQGTADAKQALLCAQMAGQTSGAIYFAVDPPATIDSNVVAYFAAINSVFQGSSLKVGVYGDGATCTTIRSDGLATYSWLAASSFNGPGTNNYSSWNIDQVVTTSSSGSTLDANNPYTFDGIQVDVDVARGDFGAFGAGSAQPGVTFPVSAQTGADGDTLTFRISIQNPNYASVADYRIYYNTTDGTAIAGKDYVGVTNPVAVDFTAGSARFIDVPIKTLNDGANDGAEAFNFNVYDFQNALLEQVQGTITDVARDDTVSVQVPAPITATAGVSTAISGVQVVDDGLNGETFTAQVSDTFGNLSVTGSGVSGSGTNNLTISGTLSQVNAALTTLSYNSAVAGSESISVKVTDSDGSTFATSFGVTITSHVNPTVYAVSTVSLAENQSIDASSLIASISNPSGDKITLDIFKDDGGGSGYFTVDGVRQPDGQWIYPPSSSSVVKYVGGSAPGSDTLEVGVYDYTTNSYYTSSTTVAATTTTAPHVAPTVFAVSSVSVPENQSIAASSLISSITNPSNDSITLDIFKDDGGGTGYFTVDGVRQPDRQWIYPPSSSSVVKYVGGSSPGTDTLEVGVYDYTTNSYFVSSTAITATTISAQSAARSDFNGDGHSDFLFQNTDATPAIWFMNGTSVVTKATLPQPPSSWQVIGSGDFNGDGKADIIWQNSDGTPAIWEMNGSTIIGAAALPTPPSSWHIIGAGDFNGDGKADLLWQNTSGTPAIWEMNGSTIIGAAALPTPPSSWRVIKAGDFNGDGKADILWQNSDGTPAIWEMNGTSIVSAVALTSPGASWQLKDDGPIPLDAMAAAPSTTNQQNNDLHLSAPEMVDSNIHASAPDGLGEAVNMPRRGAVDTFSGPSSITPIDRGLQSTSPLGGGPAYGMLPTDPGLLRQPGFGAGGDPLSALVPPTQLHNLPMFGIG
jgi:VCBS repeat-containing protein